MKELKINMKGKELYEKELLEIIEKCKFIYTLEGIEYEIKPDDINSITYKDYNRKLLGYITSNLDITLYLYKDINKTTLKPKEEVICTFLHEIAHLLEFKIGWFERHKKTHGKEFYKLHTYLIERYNEVYDNETSNKVLKYYYNRLEIKNKNKEKRKETRQGVKELRERYSKLNTPEIFNILKPYIKTSYINKITFKNFEIDLEENILQISYFYNTNSSGNATFKRLSKTELKSLYNLIKE